MNNFNSYSLNEKIVSQQVVRRAVPVYVPNRVEARQRVHERALQKQTSVIPRWLLFLLVILLTFVFCITLNVKSRLKIDIEERQQNLLRAQIEQLQNGNADLAEEIKSLQNNPASIERAARQRLNMVRANERVIVSIP